VASLNRPGGNVTGVNNLTSTLETKRFGLLRELVPQAATIGILLNPTWPLAVSQLRDMQEAAHSVGVQIHILRASSDREIDTAFETASQQRIAALVVAGDAFLNTRRDRVTALATRHAMPAMYSFRDYAVAGGLMSYGIDLPDVYRQVGIQSGRILKGAKPADLPVVQPTEFELVINLKAVKALGLNFPPGLLAIADEVIE
jgi:putative tryptophan/tyrosine transport system substrate-binding protein